MLIKSKYMLACGVLAVMAMASSAFAQTIFTVTASNTPRARMNGHAELAGGITLTGTGDNNDGGTISIDYGIPITNRFTGDDAIDVEICDGTAAVATGDDTNVSIVGSVLNVVIPTGTCAAVDVDGVRLGIAGSGLDGVSASVSATGDLRFAGGANDVSVVRSVVDELMDTGVKSTMLLTVIRHTGIPKDNPATPMMKNDGTADSQFMLVITENAVDSFEDAEINLEFGGIPPGATITLDAWVAATMAEMVRTNALELVADHDDDTTTDALTAAVGNDQVGFFVGDDMAPADEVELTAEDNEAVVLMYLLKTMVDDNTVTDLIDETADAYLALDGMTRPAEKDKVIIRGSIAFPQGEPAEPLPDVDVTVTADVGPTGRAFEGRRNTVSAMSDIPRFDSDMTSPVTVIDVTSDKTTLSLPYALFDGKHDTGIAISNMNTASEQSGTIEFKLYQTDEEMVSYTTSDELAAGGTMAILLSEILTEVGVETFRGYIMIVADFTDADGLAYISDWAAFSATATLDVVE